MTTEELIEAAARVLSPNCMWDEGYVNSHIERRRELARTKARAVISLTVEACRKEATNFLAEYHGNLSADPRRAAAQTAQEIAARISALARQVEG